MMLILMYSCSYLGKVYGLLHSTRKCWSCIEAVVGVTTTLIETLPASETLYRGMCTNIYTFPILYYLVCNDPAQKLL